MVVMEKITAMIAPIEPGQPALLVATANDNAMPKPYAERPLNRVELICIISLVRWRAKQTGQEEGRVAGWMLEGLGRPTADDLRAADYDAAIKLLVEL